MISEWINSHPSLYILPQTDSTVIFEQLTVKKTSTETNRSGSPRLTLTIKAKPDLDIDVDARYPITFPITRDVDDPENQACIIHWDPIEDGFGQRGVTLLRYNYPHTNKLRTLQVDPGQLPAKALTHEK